MRWVRNAAFLLAFAAPSWAGDFDAAIKTIRDTWPGRRTVVVVCDKNASSMALMDLGPATENVLNLLVIDLPAAKDLDKALLSLNRKKADELVLLLLQDDPVTGENSLTARMLVNRMTARRIPVVALGPVGLKAGAVFAQGPGTGDKLQVNPEAAKRLGVPLPEVPKS